MTSTDSAGRIAEEIEIDRRVGERIRELRHDKKLSLETVSERSGLSIGFLSQIERGLSSPSLRVLTSLADVLGVRFAEFFVAPSERAEAKSSRSQSRDVVVRTGRRAKLKLWRSGIHKQLLTPPAAAPSFSFYVMHMEPGATSGADLYTHAGVEAGVVSEGRLRLTVGDDSWELEKGDSFSFPSTQPHRFENADEGRTIVIMVQVPK